MPATLSRRLADRHEFRPEPASAFSLFPLFRSKRPPEAFKAVSDALKAREQAELEALRRQMLSISARIDTLLEIVEAVDCADPDSDRSEDEGSDEAFAASIFDALESLRRDLASAEARWIEARVECALLERLAQARGAFSDRARELRLMIVDPWVSPRFKLLACAAFGREWAREAADLVRLEWPYLSDLRRG